MRKTSENISRLQFLRNLGFGGSALMAVYLSSCVNETVNPASSPSGQSTTVDLSDSANAALLQDGGYIILGNIVVANIGNGKFAAVTRICSHEGEKRVIYRNGEFYCTAHGARYDTSGNGLNGNGSRGLIAYTVTEEGNVLTIF
ncbi:Rieske (2Fe-2S) protein [Marinilongibacter aquaticus]|uniref:QcrA and Rieske domain-containing protein n=1 Tax=Marinilongibacter aquaticus TaxID=2975157 RepID=UPI0021BD610A|nr:Rieske (2Fe-2S) protein [Marinilongibacter aquaticus]UBM59178.1 Rieske (2Fe-2S) protein [Marinilongibacter aquaticus]